ncbi:MAG: ABC transporter ATP-binding protein [Phycisphaerae bacterium]|nr:ABC transporter ATP-binding protein [Phycisphaerae bacterium]
MGEIVLQTQDLTKTYGRHLALDHLNLRVPEGCIYGLLGRNGSGKTTAIKLLLGFLNPTCGSSEVFGRDSRDLTPEIRARVGYVCEGHPLYKWMPIGTLENFQKAFYPDRWDTRLLDEMLDYFSLSRRQRIRSLSNGQRAQVSLALAMATSPDLLVMDDPTLGLDVAIRRQFLQGMIHLIQKKGKTVLFSSHILSDVERVVDRLAVIDKGVLRADCTLEQFRTSIRKVRAERTGPLPAGFDLPGILHCRQDDSVTEWIVVGATDEQLDQAFGQAPVKGYTCVPMNMEDQFIEFTSPVGNKRLFEWEERP